ncbi:MAG: hypothetical protein OJF49_002692 [Ktedonobacterales bacterium]|jgi:S1-C subfamily serine protease|nr:MAG: hypothetical protein OJF49_002692 [Ktedonobacterales bacterium]
MSTPPIPENPQSGYTDHNAAQRDGVNGQPAPLTPGLPEGTSAMQPPHDGQQQAATPVTPPTTPPRPNRTPLFALLGGLVAVVLAFVGGCAVGASSAKQTTNSGAVATVAVAPGAADLQQTVINVIHTVQPSVVQVMGQGGQSGGSIGSGEILRSDGSGSYIVTNDHVVTGFSNLSVLLAGNPQIYPATLVGASAQDDLAVVKIDAPNLHPITVANSSDLQVGQFAIAMGSPLGLTQSATTGIVSALDRTAGEGPGGPAPILTGLIQTSAPINPGNSGGALVDLQGRLIGVPTLGAVSPGTNASANGIGFAIPSNRVIFVADQLIKDGKLVNTGQGYLGISGTDVTPQLASAYNLPVQSGVLVLGFSNDAAGASPAQQAGIQTGDIIVAVNGQAVASNADLAGTLLGLSPGTQVTITVVRSGSQHDVKVTLGERPANPQG